MAKMKQTKTTKFSAKQGKSQDLVKKKTEYTEDEKARLAAYRERAKRNTCLVLAAGQINEIGLHEEDCDKHFVLMEDIDLPSFSVNAFNVIATGYIGVVMI